MSSILMPAKNCAFLSNFTRHFKARANNLNNPDGNFDIPRMVRPEVHRAISAGTRQNINEIVGMIGRGENVSLKMVDAITAKFRLQT